MEPLTTAENFFANLPEDLQRGLTDLILHRRIAQTQEEVKIAVTHWQTELKGTVSSKEPARCDLSIFPLLWEVVGNIHTVVRRIENEITGETKIPIPESVPSKAREKCPFLYIRNPPRHGKSLALDLLFRDRSDVLVVSITYNSSTGTLLQELGSVHSAIAGFWTRVILALTNTKEVLADVINTNPLTSWGQVVQVLPSLMERNIVICVDELSKLVSKFTGPKGTFQHFWSSLYEFQQNTHGSPFRRIVFTGFDHAPETSIAGSSYIVVADPFTLNLATPRETRRLGQHLLWLYAKKGLQFPTFLFEILKSSPGLLGTWASLALTQKEINILSLSNFCENTSISSWCNELDDSEFNRRIELIESAFFQKLSEDDIKKASDLGIGIKSIDTDNQKTFQLVPFVVVLLVNKLVDKHPEAFFGEKKEKKEKRKALFDGLAKIIGLCRAHCTAEPNTWRQFVLESFDNDEWPNAESQAQPEFLIQDSGSQSVPQGSCFEEFCLHALQLTSLILTNDNKLATVGSVFGETIFRTRNGITVFVVNERKGLSRMLTPFCYSLFPIRTKGLVGSGGFRNRIKALALSNEEIDNCFQRWCELKDQVSSQTVFDFMKCSMELDTLLRTQEKDQPFRPSFKRITTHLRTRANNQDRAAIKRSISEYRESLVEELSIPSCVTLFESHFNKWMKDYELSWKTDFSELSPAKLLLDEQDSMLKQMKVKVKGNLIKEQDLRRTRSSYHAAWNEYLAGISGFSNDDLLQRHFGKWLRKYDLDSIVLKECEQIPDSRPLEGQFCT